MVVLLFFECPAIHINNAITKAFAILLFRLTTHYILWSKVMPEARFHRIKMHGGHNGWCSGNREGDKF